jgi:3,4-dihydroxy 2-butanone 4-phosphate synthase/GTP cyclohydrolase II
MKKNSHLSSIEEIIKDAFLGKMFILVDDESRENEGDLVIPAQMADAEAINFMAKYGRGLICLSLEKERITQLNLPHMAKTNSSRFDTAFTVSIEAREGVTTGISAADRAQTIKVAINPQTSEQHITTPGHIFPLEAREGGVLVRAGHTEAAVDIARIAGLNPSGVICEIMNDDGTMARMPDLIKFAKQHNLKIATIADLIAYRRKHDKLVERQYETEIDSQFGGKFKMYVYVNKIEYAEHIVLVKGEVDPKESIIVRMHALNVLNDILGDRADAKELELQKSMEKIASVGKGVIVILREPKKNSLSELLQIKKNNENIISHAPLRDYGIGAQILLDLGIKKLKLLSNSKSHSIIGLDGYGISIDDVMPISE